MTDSTLVNIYKKILISKEIERFEAIFILQRHQTNTISIRHKCHKCQCPLWDERNKIE